MSDATGRGVGLAYAGWPPLQRALRESVARLTPEQLAMRPHDDPDRWPLWGLVGHLACSRVFWLCDIAGEPGAAESPFPNAAWACPEEDLARPLDRDALLEALDVTWRIVERCLTAWTPAMLEEVVGRPDWGEERVRSRGWILSRVATHDAWHAAEMNEALTAAGLPPIDPWE